MILIPKSKSIANQKVPMTSNSSSSARFEQLTLGISMVQEPRIQANTVSVRTGSARTIFIPQTVPQLVLLPSDISVLLPGEHIVYTVIRAVRQLDLSGILVKYEGKNRLGRPAYNPIMMLTLIVFCYCEGHTSARTIEKMAKESIPCRVITGGRTPDHDTIANFLAMHREKFNSIFQQILQESSRAGLVALEHVSVDGSKIKANASKRKAMSYRRMRREIRKLRKELKDLHNQLRQVENKTAETATRESERLRKEIAFREPRLERIEKSKNELEERVRTKANAIAQEKKMQGRKTRKDPDKVKPQPDDQINFTDPESRIMLKSGKHFEQSYNGQIVVDSLAQIIVACDVVQDTNDKKMLEPMLTQVVQRLGRSPNTASADSGYFSDQNLNSEIASSIELLIPPGREIRSSKAKPAIGRIAKNLPNADKMRRKLTTTRGKELYALRKCIVEPVFGQIKQSVLKFEHFSWRGLDNVRCQWALVCAAHNLVKLHRSGWRFESAKPLAA